MLVGAIHVALQHHLKVAMRLESMSWANVVHPVKDLRAVSPWFLVPELVTGKT